LAQETPTGWLEVLLGLDRRAKFAGLDTSWAQRLKIWQIEGIIIESERFKREQITA